MLVEDYRPTKRLGVEELEGLVSILERRIDEKAMGDPTPREWVEWGAWLATHMLLTGSYRYPDDFMAVFDVKCDELIVMQ